MIDLQKESFIVHGLPPYRDARPIITETRNCGPCRRCPPTEEQTCPEIDMNLYMPIAEKRKCPIINDKDWIKHNVYDELNIHGTSIKDSLNSGKEYINLSVIDSKLAKGHTQTGINKSSSDDVYIEISLAKKMVQTAETELKNAQDELEKIREKGTKMLNSLCFTEDDYSKILSDIEDEYNNAKNNLDKAKLDLTKAEEYAKEKVAEEEAAAEAERIRLAEEAAAEAERIRLAEEAAEKERIRLAEEAAEKERARLAEIARLKALNDWKLFYKSVNGNVQKNESRDNNRNSAIIAVIDSNMLKEASNKRGERMDIWALGGGHGQPGLRFESRGYFMPKCKTDSRNIIGVFGSGTGNGYGWNDFRKQDRWGNNDIIYIHSGYKGVSHIMTADKTGKIHYNRRNITSNDCPKQFNMTSNPNLTKFIKQFYIFQTNDKNKVFTYNDIPNSAKV